MSDTIQSRIGAILRGTRKEKGYTKETLADAAEVSVKTVKRAEAGERVSAESLRALCSVLELDAAAVLADALASPADSRRWYLGLYPLSPTPSNRVPGDTTTVAVACGHFVLTVFSCLSIVSIALGQPGGLAATPGHGAPPAAALEAVAALIRQVEVLVGTIVLPLACTFLGPLVREAMPWNRGKRQKRDRFEIWPVMAQAILVGSAGAFGTAVALGCGWITVPTATTALHGVVIAQLVGILVFAGLAWSAACDVQRRRKQVRRTLADTGAAYLAELGRIAADRLSGDAVASAERVLEQYRALAVTADWFEGLRMVERFVEDLANGTSGTAGLLEHLERARCLDAEADGAPSGPTRVTLESDGQEFGSRSDVATTCPRAH